MKKWQKILVITVSYILAVALGCTLAFVIFLQRDGGFDKLQKLHMLIEDRYIGTVDEQKLFDGAAAGMVSGTGDRWSYYISESAMAQFTQQKNNQLVGVGITISMRTDGQGADILKVVEDSPAQKAGVLAGDILYKVGDKLVSEMGVDATSQEIGGKKGTQVRFSVLRNGQIVECTATRDTIRLPVAEGQMLEENIGYVRIDNFNTNCAKETIALVEQLVEQGAQSLVFDVRNNGGGYVTELVRVLDYLLPEGKLFISEYYDGERTVDYSDKDCLELPMVVLVNASSYSAAEFFPAALREYEWAQVVGTPTVGKGYFQETYRLGDGSAVALSTGKYFTPQGVSLADQGGLVPDVVIEVDAQTEAAIYAQTLPLEEDPQLQAALELLR